MLPVKKTYHRPIYSLIHDFFAFAGSQFSPLLRLVGIFVKSNVQSMHDLCKSQEETYHHLIYECDKVVPFWTGVKAWISIETNANIKFSITEIILRTPSDIHSIFDVYLTIANMHIYSCKFQYIVPGIEGFAKTH